MRSRRLRREILPVIAVEIISPTGHAPFLPETRQVGAEDVLAFPQRGDGDFLLDPVAIPHRFYSSVHVGGQGDVVLIVSSRRPALPSRLCLGLRHGQGRRRVRRNRLRQEREPLVESGGVELAFGHVFAANGHDLVEGLLVLRGKILRRDFAAVAALLKQQALPLRLKRRPRIDRDGILDGNVVCIPLPPEVSGLGVPLGLKRREAGFRQAVDLAVGLTLLVRRELPKLLAERPLLGVNRVAPVTRGGAVDLLGGTEIIGLLRPEP